MRVRTGHAPGDWTANEPAAPHQVRHRYQTVPAAVVGEMRPVISSGAYLENRKRTKPSPAYSLHFENRR